MKGQFQFLGSGASLGVPVMGCSCDVCRSTNPKNKRLRPSALIQYDGKRILLDCGPDIRQQAIQLGLEDIDGLILTHTHYDHVEGLDELRAFTLKHRRFLPCLLSRESLDELKSRFYYIFEHQKSEQIIITKLDWTTLPEKRGEIDFLGATIKYFTFEQMKMPVQGIRIGNLSYVSDIKTYPESIFEDLAGTETLVISALRYTDSLMHLTVDEAVAFARRVGAKKTWLTHISHDLDHEKTNAYLPDDIQLSYDGLKLEFEG